VFEAQLRTRGGMSLGVGVEVGVGYACIRAVGDMGLRRWDEMVRWDERCRVIFSLTMICCNAKQ
jgi:hypothetical protein